jgi:hypothetical protein
MDIWNEHEQKIIRANYIPGGAELELKPESGLGASGFAGKGMKLGGRRSSRQNGLGSKFFLSRTKHI